MSDDRNWSGEVTEKSDSLDLEEGVFTLDDPREIARSLAKSAEESKRKKSGAFQSAMSMLTFYMNRAGDSLDEERREILEQAKDELRDLYDRPRKDR